MEGKTNTIFNAAGLKITMDSGDLPKQDPQTPAICPKCGSPGHNDSTQQLCTKKMLHMCSHCDECFCTVPNAESESGPMTGFYSVVLKAISPYEKAESHYQCLLCNKMFGTLSDRNAHMAKHTGVDTHMCTQCGFLSNEKSAVEAHMATHREEHSYKCPVCCQVFGTSTEMDQHLTSHLGDALHRCTQCSFVSTVQSQMMTLSLVQSEAMRHAGMITQNINIRITYSCSSKSNQSATVLGNDDQSDEGESSNVPWPIKSEKDSEDDYHSGKEESLVSGPDNTKVHSVLSHSEQPETMVGKHLKSVEGENSHPGQLSNVKPRARRRGKNSRKPVATCTAAEKAPKSHYAEIYKCPYCSNEFGHEAWLKRHLKSHSRCVLCKSMFSSPDELNIHILTHTVGKELKCTVCDKWFSDLQTHMTTHAGNTDGHDVQGCPEAATTQENAKVHAPDKPIKSIVSEKGGTESDKPHKCSVCGKGFLKRVHLLAHQRTHDREKSFACSLCGQRCATPLSFKRHMERHTVEKQHQCSYCGKKISTAASLSEHMATQHAAGEKSHQCDICEKQFPSKAYLRKHVKSHSEEKPHACSQCDKRYRTKGLLKRHMMIHTESIQCSYCGKQLCDAVSLKHHEMIHTGETPFPCSLCDKRFRHKGRLNEHMMSHTAERPHMCSVCGKTFPTATGLRSHMKIHSENKPHECSDCGKKFYHVGNLKSHMTSHTGVKPYSCNECGRSFANKSSFQRHSHTLKRRGRKKKTDYEELTETVVEVSTLDQPFVPEYGGDAPEPYSIITVEVISDV